MPVIQQTVYRDDDGAERRVSTVAGLPDRWGRTAYRELQAALKKHGARSDKYQELCALLDAIVAAPIPVDATDAQLSVLGEQCAADCSRILAEFVSYVAAGPVAVRELLASLGQVCARYGIEPPTGDDDDGAVKRLVDASWWRTQLRRAHGRVFEHAALRLGFVSRKTGSYCSNETVTRRRQQIARNRAALEASWLCNEKGDKFSLYDLAQKGMANKANRKGELMLRMAGCEEIAREYGHVGLFVTMTCPSKYHAVLAGTGTPNPKYQNATPRDAQAYLNRTWARIRAQNDRDGIAPYGFRIAEPHHDGCPHWHMLVFVPPGQADAFVATLGEYARAEDAEEMNSDAAKDARLKVIQIDPNKGTAAGYIAKYVGKNIDDSQGAAHDEEGPVEASASAPCERVDAWASVWGIRQFQGLGMPPVTVWRELRRVKEDNDQAPDYVKRALSASRRIEGAGPCLDGRALVLKPADFAEYMRAQGGVNLGRDYLVRIACNYLDEVPGRYGLVEKAEPVGVYGETAPDVVCASMRYTWHRVAGGSPWSPLNNCTGGEAARGDQGPTVPVWWVEGQAEYADFDDPDWWEGQEFAENYITPVDQVEMLDAAIAAGWEMWARSDAIQAARMARA
jgi:hypothetical protein